MNLTPEQQWTIAMLFAAKVVEDAVLDVQGFRPPWWATVAVVILPFPPTDSH